MANIHSSSCKSLAIQLIKLTQKSHSTNRKQFSSPIVSTSIPRWQLQSQRNAAVGDGDVDKHDDDGSADGSGGSSETEVVTKNSDSSLELM